MGSTPWRETHRVVLQEFTGTGTTAKLVWCHTLPHPAQDLQGSKPRNSAPLLGPRTYCYCTHLLTTRPSTLILFRSSLGDEGDRHSCIRTGQQTAFYREPVSIPTYSMENAKARIEVARAHRMRSPLQYYGVGPLY